MNHPFTDQFIAMARAAEEIQAMRPPFEPGDAVFVTHKEWDCQVWVGSVHYDDGMGIWSSHGETEEEDLPSLWIPRLDQLVLMLDDYSYIMQAVSDATHGGEWHEEFLSAVMSKKFGKTWDGKGWVKA